MRRSRWLPQRAVPLLGQSHNRVPACPRRLLRGRRFLRLRAMHPTLTGFLLCPMRRRPLAEPTLGSEGNGMGIGQQARWHAQAPRSPRDALDWPNR